LDRSLAVGSVPSIQMYSALNAMGLLPPGWKPVRGAGEPTLSILRFRSVAGM
jgi:hypothetical protein